MTFQPAKRRLPYKLDKNVKWQLALRRSENEAVSRKEILIVRAQWRAHRRIEEYARVVREGVLEFEQSEKLTEWTLVVEARKLIERLRKSNGERLRDRKLGTATTGGIVQHNSTRRSLSFGGE